MQILDTAQIDENSALYAVELAPGFMVDVKVCADTGLVYVMQNEDGSTVYWAANADYTFPEYEYDEKAVVQFVKENLPRQRLDAVVKNAERRKNSGEKPAARGILLKDLSKAK